MDLLEETIGKVKMQQYLTKGYIDVLGTNKAIYRIYADGSLEKHVLRKKLLRYTCEIEWHGKIESPRIPFHDAVATVYTHIIRDSRKFDIAKGCGEIHVLSGLDFRS